MLVAIDKSNKRRLAWTTSKEEGPFRCPECDGAVVIKKGHVKEHHYAHKPPFTCQYGTGESQIHYKAKKELYLSFVKHPRCDKCEIERRLEGVRPDVSLYIDRYPVAIEIQRSTVDIYDIIRKAKIYSKLGIYLIYLLPQREPKQIWHSGEERYVCRPNQWEKFLHAMFYGRVYYWQGALNINAVHFEEFQTWVEEKEWYDSYGDVQYGGGFYKTTKSLKIPRQCSSVPLNIVEDFRGADRSFHVMEDWNLPACKLWIDQHKKWW